MDTMLLTVTVVSLLVAVVSSTVAWRLARAERTRTAARVAALAAAAGVDRMRNTVSDLSRSETTSSAAAEVPGGLHEFMPARPMATASAGGTNLASGVVVDAGAIFTRPAVDSGSSSRQHTLMAAAAVFALVVVGGGAAMFVSGRTPGAGPAAPRTPLELVALSHQRTDGLLAVSGLVRNPANGTDARSVKAEVRVFDAAGIMIATRSATLDTALLAPGQESPFVVTVGEATTAARYRVSFATDGTMLPHVDRRTNLPAAITADAR